MSLPSITDASESKKKLQCAWSRPSSASERCAGVIAELQERQPAMADFLAEDADACCSRRGTSAAGSSGILANPVHHHEAAQPSGAAEIARRVEDVDADAADLVGHGRLERERVVDDRRVGPDDQLIVVVGVRLIELAGDLDRVELRLLGEPLADGAGAAGRRTVRRSDRPA